MRLHQTLEFIEEDFNAGRITFREALVAYEEFLEEASRVAHEAELEAAWGEGYEAALEDTLLPPSDLF